MSIIKKTYTLGKIKQLIDLNGESTNFELSFTIKCKDDTPFQILVVDQTTLDNSTELDYKDARKVISGNIIADKNIYQNYYLILRSEVPCVVDVELNKKELPLTPTSGFPDMKEIEKNDNVQSDNVQSDNVQSDNVQSDNVQSNNVHRNLQSNNKSFFTWKRVLLFFVIVGGVILLYYLYKRKDTTKENEINNFEVPEDNLFHKTIQNTSDSSYKPVDGSSHKQSHFLEEVNNNIEFKPKSSQFCPEVKSNYSSVRSNDGALSLIDRLKKFSKN
jgi:hypothetical protein